MAAAWFHRAHRSGGGWSLLLVCSAPVLVLFCWAWSLSWKGQTKLCVLKSDYVTFLPVVNVWYCKIIL